MFQVIPVDDGAAFVIVEEAEAQALQLVVDPGPQVHNDLALHETRQMDRVHEREPSTDQGEREDGGRDDAENDERRPGRGRRQAERPMGRPRRRIELVTDEIDPYAGESQARQTQSQERRLESKDLEAAALVVPAQKQETFDQRRV